MAQPLISLFVLFLIITPFSSLPKPSPTKTPTRKPSTRPATSVPSYKSSTLPTFAPTEVPTAIPSTTTPSAEPSSDQPSVPSPTVGSTIIPTSISYEVDIHYHYPQPIMKGTIHLYNIYLGDFLNKTTFLLDYLAANIGGSPWYNMITSYFQENQNGTRIYATNAAEFMLSVGVKYGQPQVNFTDNDVSSLIVNLINSNYLPMDSDGVYAVLFTDQINYDGWLQTWCGKHGAFYASQGNNTSLLKFLAIGDPSLAANGWACQAISDGSATANNDLAADSIATMYAHELVETVTDCMFAWYFDSGSLAGAENGDACVWDFGDTTNNWNVVFGNKSFLIQRNWVPHYGCRLFL